MRSLWGIENNNGRVPHGGFFFASFKAFLRDGFPSIFPFKRLFEATWRIVGVGASEPQWEVQCIGGSSGLSGSRVWIKRIMLSSGGVFLLICF